MVFICFCFCFVLLPFLGLLPRHMEDPRLGVQLELQPQAYATAIATPDLSFVCDLQHSSRQGQILNPLSKARDGTRNLVVPSQIRFRCATPGTLRGDDFLLLLPPLSPSSPTIDRTSSKCVYLGLQRSIRRGSCPQRVCSLLRSLVSQGVSS